MGAINGRWGPLGWGSYIVTWTEYLGTWGTLRYWLGICVEYTKILGEYLIVEYTRIPGGYLCMGYTKILGEYLSVEYTKIPGGYLSVWHLAWFCTFGGGMTVPANCAPSVNFTLWGNNTLHRIHSRLGIISVLAE